MTASRFAQSDTIAAISTGMVTAGIGVVRISGPEAVQIADKVFVPARRGEKTVGVSQRGDGTVRQGHLEKAATHTIHYGSFCDGDERIDEVLVMLMRAPRTYTGEDTVEINCHGGLFVLSRVLDTVIAAGARAAEPGEFTKRAFLNGKMDLSRAEAVAGLIESENERARKASVRQLSGGEETLIREHQAEILEIMAHAEAALDDPEHLSVDGELDKFVRRLEAVEISLVKLHETAGYGRLITQGIRTAIVGKPNAGKSSLLNYLLGEERAIVSDIAGTTRDTVSERVNLGSCTLTMVDTAGINSTEDPIEKIGVERAQAEIEKADLILYVVDTNRPLDENDETIICGLKGKNVIAVLNKSDLECFLKEDELTAKLQDEGGLMKTSKVSVSAKQRTGLEELTQAIEEMFFSDRITQEEVVLLNKRHEYALSDAIGAVRETIRGIRARMSEEFWLVDLQDAYDHLGEITGETVGENLIDEIFGKFCMGK